MKSTTQEEVVELSISSGASSGAVSFEPEGGKYSRAVIFYKGGNNDSIVNASLNFDGGDYVFKPQCIDNFADKNSQYMDKHPIKMMGGKKMTFRITASENFSSDLTAQLILIKEIEE